MLKFRGGGALLHKLKILLWCFAMRNNVSPADCINLNNAFFIKALQTWASPPKSVHKRDVHIGWNVNSFIYT